MTTCHPIKYEYYSVHNATLNGHMHSVLPLPINALKMASGIVNFDPWVYNKILQEKDYLWTKDAQTLSYSISEKRTTSHKGQSGWSKVSFKG